MFDINKKEKKAIKILYFIEITNKSKPQYKYSFIILATTGLQIKQ